MITKKAWWRSRNIWEGYVVRNKDSRPIPDRTDVVARRNKNSCKAKRNLENHCKKERNQLGHGVNITAHKTFTT